MGLNFHYYDGLQPKMSAGMIKEHECNSQTAPKIFFKFSGYFLNDFIKNPQTTTALTFLTHIISAIGGVDANSVNQTLNSESYKVALEIEAPQICRNCLKFWAPLSK